MKSRRISALDLYDNDPIISTIVARSFVLAVIYPFSFNSRAFSVAGVDKTSVFSGEVSRTGVSKNALSGRTTVEAVLQAMTCRSLICLSLPTPSFTVRKISSFDFVPKGELELSAR